jgi:hypothetical protein
VIKEISRGKGKGLKRATEKGAIKSLVNEAGMRRN